MSTFDPTAALEAFRKALVGRGLSENSLSVRDGFEAMLDFYRDVRASGCSFDQDGDMLLFQWGTYDTFPRAGGIIAEAFDLNLTRQLIVDARSEDDDIWQLALNFEFAPTGQLRALGSGNKWCHSLQELQQFRDDVLGSVAFKACSHLKIQRITLAYQCAG